MPEIHLEPKLIKAGAGTGKTACLIDEVYSLFKGFRENKGRNPKLIVCTFTRKASQELKQRLFEKAIEELSERGIQSLNQQKVRKEKKDALENQTLFLNYIQSPSLYISTIDGILNMFLRKYGHKFDLSPDFQLYHGQVNEKLFDSMAEEFVFKKNFSLLKKIPYPFLKELFLFYFKCRLKYGEISFYDEKDFEEFNQQRNLFLESECLFKSESSKQFDVVKIREQLAKDERPLAKLLAKDINEVKKLFGEEDSFKASEFIPLLKEFHQAGKEFFLNFIEKKKNKAFLDMEDLLLFSLALLREKPKTAQDFSKDWDYWLIDEYQDTSWIQEQIIYRVTGFENVFCVGDPAQSIYLFRDADPHVFKRREKSLGDQVKKLDINHRSLASLIYFYNDFFPENKGFIKIKSPGNKQTPIDKTCVYFLTYKKTKDQKSKQQAFKALDHYIQRLISEGFSYSDIAVLSSKNDDLVEIAAYLRSQNLPLMLHSSKNFAQKRLILDALFLLKFLINPYDNTNLKALLRTPYFRLSDQELTNSSYEHFEFCKNKEPVSFWSFIKGNFSDRVFTKALSSYLNVKKEQGLVKGFERALMDSGFMDFSYLQDPTGSSESNLWKFLSLLNENSTSPLELFYSLMDEEDKEDRSKEVPSCDNSESIKLMTIHKSKGLEFDNVIVMDFSIGNSSLKTGHQVKDLIVYDETRKKMAFAVPIGGREKPRVKSYGHKIYNTNKEKERLLEKDRLFYVAMTRAKQSVAIFIPHLTPPEQNSWLNGVSFFKEFVVSESRHPLLEEQYDEKNKKKLKLWKLNEGSYKTSQYLFCVQSVESICESPSRFIDFNSKSKSFFCVKKAEQEKENSVLTGKIQHFKTKTQSIYESEGDSIDSARGKEIFSFAKKEDQKRKNATLTGGEKYFKTIRSLKIKSSKDFVNDTMERSKLSNEDKEAYKNLQFIKDKKEESDFSDEKVSDSKRLEISNKESEINFKDNLFLQKGKESSFYLSKVKNVLFKKNLGNCLHSFLQSLSYQSFEQVQSLIESSFLSEKDQEQIKKALTYVIQLKEPQIKIFLKRGFSEWPFKLKRQNIILQGQIDLWAWSSNEIYLFDYKSSLSQSLQAQKQLIFYSWILDEFYHPKNIWMHEVYPFQQTIKQKLYSKSHKKTFETWLKSLIQNKNL